MNALIHNISKILHIEDQGRSRQQGSEMSHFPVTENAWLQVVDGKIHSWGSMDEGLPESFDVRVNAKGGMLLPTWVDSHTHLVYAGTREDEFAQRLHGASYEEIAARGGGILNSARKLRQVSEDQLLEQAARRLHEVMQLGTGAIEIKSGYGLSTESEIKMLRVARKLGKKFPLPVKTSFLGAHAIPREFKNDRRAYLNLIIDEMLPEIATQKLADYVDVFCEEGYFSVDETLEIVEAGRKFGIKSKLHVNQFNSLGFIRKENLTDVVSVDHLEVLGSENDGGTDEAAVLGHSNTIATLLPGCSLYLEIPYGPARRLINQNATVALATDYNPGSAPCGNMNLAVQLGCIKMKMTPEESISAATLNGAAALELGQSLGSIEKGKRANLIITPPLVSPSFIPYNFGHNPISKVFFDGKPLSKLKDIL